MKNPKEWKYYIRTETQRTTDWKISDMAHAQKTFLMFTGRAKSGGIFWKDSTEPFDIIAGTFFIVGAPSDSEEFESLPEDKLETYAKRFAHPECFFKAFGKLHMLSAKYSFTKSL